MTSFNQYTAAFSTRMPIRRGTSAALLAADAADGLSVSWEPRAAFISSSGDMAYDYGRATTTLADGTVVEGSYLVVWTKEGGEWKAAADIFN